MALQQNKESLTTLLHGEGAAITSALLVAVKYSTENVPYNAWRGGFADTLTEMRLGDLQKSTEFQQGFDKIAEQYSGIKDDIIDAPEYKDLINKVRGTGIPRRWDYERFFINNTSESTSSKILGAHLSGGGYKNWSPEDIEQIQSSNKVLVGSGENLGKRFTMEGHHGESISSMQFDDMKQVYDPDNIRIGTAKWHLQEGHGGAWTNQYSERYTDISDRAEDIRNGERNHFDSAIKYDDSIGISMGIAAGSICAIIKYSQLSKSHLPWSRKKCLEVVASFASGAITGFVPYVAIQHINTPVRNLLENTLSEAFASGEMVDPESFLGNLADAGGDFTIIIAAISIRTLLQGGMQIHQIGGKAALSNIVATLGRTTVEQGAFFAIDLLLDNLTPIPDPALAAIVTTLRVTYSVGKIGFSIKHQKELATKRICYLHDAAYAIVAT
jgi:hypothetical protein